MSRLREITVLSLFLAFLFILSISMSCENIRDDACMNSIIHPIGDGVSDRINVRNLENNSNDVWLTPDDTEPDYSQEPNL